MNRPTRLSAAFVQTVKRPGRYGDGRGGYGLSLRVQERAGGGVAKSWSQRVRIHGRAVNLGLGAYPVVSLARAREKALENRWALDAGRDPRDKRPGVPAFADALDPVIALYRPSWKPGGREESIWRSSLQRHAVSSLGHMRVDQITPADVLAVVTPIIERGQHDLAQRVRMRIGAVMRWAQAHGYRHDNPAGEAVLQALPRRRGPRPHYRALSYDQVAGAIHQVRSTGTHTSTALCFEFLVLTAARSGEARLAQWEEIDFDTETWTVPAERMKARRIHRVPLSWRAAEVLQEAANLRENELIFPSVRGKALSDAALSKRLRDLKIPAVPHAFRASFRTWASEQTDAPRAVMEAALAHRLGDLTEQAYARSDLFEKRRELMRQWADYLLSFPQP